MRKLLCKLGIHEFVWLDKSSMSRFYTRNSNGALLECKHCKKRIVERNFNKIKNLKGDEFKLG